MRRDMDLARHILMEVEDADRPVKASELVGDDRTFPEIVYHIELLRAHGLVDARVDRAKGATVAVVGTLTWDGCDFLDSMRDDRVWERAERLAREAVGSTSLNVLVPVCAKVAESAVVSRLGA